MKSELNLNNYLTFDFCLATTLTSKGFSVIGLDRSNPKRIGFQFENDNQLQNAIRDFWEAKLLVSPQEFYAHQRVLKARMYSEEKQ